jgi:hypothetical protein
MVMLEMFFAMFIMVGFIVPSVCYATHVFSPQRSGLIAGIGAGSYGAMVALTMPVFGRLLDLRAYEAAFGLAAALPAVGFAAWAWVNRRER